MTRDAITILHVSDMQFGKFNRFAQKQPGTPPNDYDTLTQRLILDLDYLSGKSKTKQDKPVADPDLVICTGDLAEWGLPKEFKQAFDFLGRIAEHLKLTRDRVIVIPGNHDVNRKQCASYFSECEADETEIVFPWFPKWKQFKEAFDEFYLEFPSITFTPAEPWTLFEIRDLRVVVAGLNSTMDEGHDEAVNGLADPGHHGLCTESQLRWFEKRLESDDYGGWLRIGAIHHNIERGCRNDNENLRDAEELGNILGGSLDLILHGHTHHAKTAQIKGTSVYSTGSASLLTRGADAIPTDVPNQYQIITVRSLTFIRHCRQYNGAASPPKWIGDNSVSENGDLWVVVDSSRLAHPHQSFGAKVEERREFHDHSQLGARIDIRRFGEADSAHFADQFLNRVTTLTELRHCGAHLQKLQWQFQNVRCLTVAWTDESGVSTDRPVATSPQCPTLEELDALSNDIVRHYRAGEPRLFADWVCGEDAEFSHELLTAATLRGVHLVRVGEYRGLIDLTEFIQQQTGRIEKLQAAAGYRTDWYVNQRMTIEAAGATSQTDDALSLVCDWMQRPEPTFVLLLGEPGTGKTFLSLELARRLADQQSMRPILVELRRMEKSKSVPAMLGALFADYQQASDPVKLDHMIREGAVTLIFDGFDELALRVGYVRAADHLNEIIAAAHGDAPHMIITSRTSHFESDRQIRNKLAEALQRDVKGLRYCHLLPFEQQQIHDCLRKRFGAEADAWMQLLRDVEDLIGLSTIPRMLAFITSVEREMLEQARNLETGTVSAGDVYRLIIVEQWLPFEYQRMNQPGSAELFTPEQMLEAVRHLAHALWQTTDKFISLGELEDQAQQILEKFAPDKQGQELHATHQLGSGTLLMLDADGRFTFIHQSVMEWLVAEQAAREIKMQGDTQLLDDAEISSLMADFIINLAGRSEAGDWATDAESESLKSKPSNHRKANALLIWRRFATPFRTTSGEANAGGVESARLRSYANQDLSGRDLSAEYFRNAHTDGVKLFEAILVKSDLSGARLSRADLRSANLEKANLSHSILQQADLSGANLSYADLSHADLTGANLTRSTLICGGRY